MEDRQFRRALDRWIEREDPRVEEAAAYEEYLDKKEREK